MPGWMTSKRIRCAIGIITMLAALATMSVGATDVVTQSVTGGSLAASVADLTLGSVPYSHDVQTSTGTMTLTADDSTGNDQGWNVTIQTGDFAYSGTSPYGTAIQAANFAITSANPPTLVSGQAIDATGGPKVPGSGATGTLETPRKVLQAASAFGAGSYRQTLDVSLTIPANSRPGTYAGTLAISITAGP